MSYKLVDSTMDRAVLRNLLDDGSIPDAELRPLLLAVVDRADALEALVENETKLKRHIMELEQRIREYEYR